MAGTRSRSGRGLAIGVVAAIVIAVAAALASGSARGPAATPFVPSSGDVASLRAAETATPRPGSSGASAASASASSPGSPASGVPGSVAIDPTLLTVLPLTIGGTPLSEDPVTEQRDAADPSNAGDLAALAVAAAMSGGTGDLAIAAVVRVRPDTFSEAYFADWRSTFDAGACSQAGGVASTGRATIAGHDTFTGTCAGGLLTYHVHLADRGLIVSISSLGSGEYGRLIVEGIR